MMEIVGEERARRMASMLVRSSHPCTVRVVISGSRRSTARVCGLEPTSPSKLRLFNSISSGEDAGESEAEAHSATSEKDATGPIDAENMGKVGRPIQILCGSERVTMTRLSAWMSVLNGRRMSGVIEGKTGGFCLFDWIPST